MKKYINSHRIIIIDKLYFMCYNIVMPTKGSDNMKWAEMLDNKITFEAEESLFEKLWNERDIPFDLYISEEDEREA